MQINQYNRDTAVLNRRNFISTCTVGGVGLLAGCASSDSTGEQGRTPPPGETPTPPTPGNPTGESLDRQAGGADDPAPDVLFTWRDREGNRPPSDEPVDTLVASLVEGELNMDNTETLVIDADGAESMEFVHSNIETVSATRGVPQGPIRPGEDVAEFQNMPPGYGDSPGFAAIIWASEEESVLIARWPGGAPRRERTLEPPEE